MVDTDDQLKMNGKYTTIKTIDCSNPKTVKEVPERYKLLLICAEQNRKNSSRKMMFLIICPH